MRVLSHSGSIEILPYLLDFRCGSLPVDVMASGAQANGCPDAQSSRNDSHRHSGQQLPGAQGTTHREADFWFIHSRQLPLLLRDTNDYYVLNTTFRPETRMRGKG